jgi:hypothetical protein
MALPRSVRRTIGPIAPWPRIDRHRDRGGEEGEIDMEERKRLRSREKKRRRRGGR